MQAGVRSNRGENLTQVISGGTNSLRPGFEYLVTRAAELWLPPSISQNRAITVENVTANTLIVNATTPTISGASGGFVYSGLRRAAILSGQRARFVGTGDRWIASGAILTQPDPFAANLELALPLNTATGLIDQSPSIRSANDATAGTAKTVTVFGSGAISTTQSKYYGSSLSLNGTDQYITVSGHTVPGTGDFCYEGWYYQSATKSNAYLLDTGGGGLDSIVLYFSSTDLIAYHNGGNRVSITSSAAAWNHFALWRLSGVWRLSVNGVIGATYSSSANLSSTSFFIGNYVSASSTYAFNGNIQDFRYYQGTAKYGTTNFTPPGSIV